MANIALGIIELVLFGVLAWITFFGGDKAVIEHFGDTSFVHGILYILNIVTWIVLILMIITFAIIIIASIR